MHQLILSALFYTATALAGNHIIAAGAQPCFDGPAYVMCSDNMAREDCAVLREAIDFINSHVPGAYKYNGRTEFGPGKIVTASNVIIVGYSDKPLSFAEAVAAKQGTIAATSMVPEPVTGCTVMTIIEVRIRLERPFTHDAKLHVFTHELVHALGVDHGQMPNSLMAPSGPVKFIGAPCLTAEELRTLRAIYGPQVH